MFLLALQWWVLQTTGSPLSLTLLAMADAIPMLIFGPLAGLWVDRWERRQVLITLNLASGGVVLVIAALALAHQLVPWHIYTAMFALGLLSTPLFPAISASIPDLVPPGYLPQANAFMQMTMSMGGLVGYGVSGFVTGLFGLSAVILFDALSFLMAAALMGLARFRSQGDQRPQQPVAPRELLAGIHIVWNEQVVRVLTGVALVFGFFYATILALLPAFVAQHLQQDAQGFGIVRAALSLGMLVGPFAAGFWARRGRHGARTLTTILLSGLAIVAFSMSPLLWIAMFTLFLVGFFDGVSEVLSASILQARIPGEVRGRAFSILATAAMGVRVLGVGIGGPLALLLTVQGYFLFAGACITVVALLAFFTEVRLA